MKAATLVARVARRAGLYRYQAGAAIVGLALELRAGVAAMDRITIHGLGTFKAVRVSAREVPDFGHGRMRLIPSHFKISFTPSRSFRRAVT